MTELRINEPNSRWGIPPAEMARYDERRRRQILIDCAVLAVEHRNWWREFLAACESWHRSGDGLSPENCMTCGGVLGAVRHQFRKLCRCPVCRAIERMDDDIIAAVTS